MKSKNEEDVLNRLSLAEDLIGFVKKQCQSECREAARKWIMVTYLAAHMRCSHGVCGRRNLWVEIVNASAPLSKM